MRGKRTPCNHRLDSYSTVLIACPEPAGRKDQTVAESEGENDAENNLHLFHGYNSIRPAFLKIQPKIYSGVNICSRIYMFPGDLRTLKMGDALHKPINHVRYGVVESGCAGLFRHLFPKDVAGPGPATLTAPYPLCGAGSPLTNAEVRICCSAHDRCATLLHPPGSRDTYRYLQPAPVYPALGRPTGISPRALCRCAHQPPGRSSSRS